MKIKNKRYFYWVIPNNVYRIIMKSNYKTTLMLFDLLCDSKFKNDYRI